MHNVGSNQGTAKIKEATYFSVRRKKDSKVKRKELKKSASEFLREWKHTEGQRGNFQECIWVIQLC